jgi:hypothetical protein
MLLLALNVLCQNKLPSALSEKSTLAQILTWIDKVIPQASVELDSNEPDPEPGELITDVTPYSEWAEFSPGFKLSENDGCKVKLSNEKTALLKYSSKYPDPRKGSFHIPLSATYPSVFTIQLNSLSEKGGKRPFEHRKKGAQAVTWRVTYRLRGSPWPFIPRLPSKEKIKKAIQNPPLRITLIGSGQNGRDESMNGDTLSFSFGSKAIAEQFDASFRLAISKCQ